MQYCVKHVFNSIQIRNNDIGHKSLAKHKFRFSGREASGRFLRMDCHRRWFHYPDHCLWYLVFLLRLFFVDCKRIRLGQSLGIQHILYFSHLPCPDRVVNRLSAGSLRSQNCYSDWNMRSGMLVIVPLVEKAIALFGWRNAYLFLAGMVLLIVGPLNAIFSRRSPAELNLHPDGDHKEMQACRPQPFMIMKVVDEDWAKRDWTLRKALQTRRFWFLVATFFCLSYAYQGTLLHSISAMVDSGSVRQTAAAYFGLLGIAGSVGKILFGSLSDRFGRERSNTVGGITAAFGIFGLINTTTANSFLPLLFALLFGLGYGAAVAADALCKCGHLYWKIIRPDFCHDQHWQRCWRCFGIFFVRFTAGYIRRICYPVVHMYFEPIAFMHVCLACRSTQGQADGEKQRLTPTSVCHKKSLLLYDPIGEGHVIIGFEPLEGYRIFLD